MAVILRLDKYETFYASAGFYLFIFFVFGQKQPLDDLRLTSQGLSISLFHFVFYSEKSLFPLQAWWLIFSVNTFLQVFSASLCPLSLLYPFQTVNKSECPSAPSHLCCSSSSSEERANEWCSLYWHKTFPSLFSLLLSSLFANEQC